MGEEISQTLFDAETFGRFGDCLREETQLLSDLSATQRLSEEGFVIGFEIEAWLLDHGFFPHAVNEHLLKRLARYGDRFLRRVFTDQEIAYCMRRRNPAPHLAGRFAASTWSLIASRWN